jgi:hypothetical protein
MTRPFDHVHYHAVEKRHPPEEENPQKEIVRMPLWPGA